MEQEEDVVDSALFCKAVNNKKVPSIEALNSEMPCKGLQKERGRRVLKTLLNRLRLRRCASVTISKPDPTYRVAYLGNVVTGWAKGKNFLF
ncbi:PID 2 domain containing protein [Asbolus verrucosus]|uniref:PID 2 domain containing protein n=1 Tax=Asbolus verrucosus TaxID=1661398 RepID=A0A482V642_ASBVE|nr:PID 2 domain containing protein [Asbolus verrucosus]